MLFRIFLLMFLSPLATDAVAQHDPIVDSILREGRRLYRSEMASWHGSDLFVQRFPERRLQTGGYFSYDIDDGKTRCVFFSNGKRPKVLATINFDQTFNAATAVVDSAVRSMSEREMTLYRLRNEALKHVNSDTLFKVYENSQLNLIPLADGETKRVFVLTGPSVGGVVIFGNDYLINFNDDGEVATSRALHKNLLPFYYKDTDEVSMHSHAAESGDYITPTDICTLLLYERFTPWKQHVVVSDRMVSIWDCATEELITMPRDSWDKMMQEKEP